MRLKKAFYDINHIFQWFKRV